MGGIVLQCVGTLYNDTLDGVKIAENERNDITTVNNIIEMEIISTNISTSLLIYTLFLIHIVFFVQKIKDGLVRFKPQKEL